MRCRVRCSGKRNFVASKKPWDTLIPWDNPFLPGWTPKEPALDSEGSNDDESSSDGGSGEDKPVCDPLAMPRNWAWCCLLFPK